jgi:hypothetical protein
LGVSLGTVVPGRRTVEPSTQHEARLAPHRRVHVLRRPAAARRCGIGTGAMKNEKPTSSEVGDDEWAYGGFADELPSERHDRTSCRAGELLRTNAWRQLVTVI